jgi:hypothetical protein
MKENYVEWAKNDAKEKAEEILKRSLSLSEIFIIEEAVTLEEVPRKFDQVMQMNLPDKQYTQPKVKTYDPKIGHSFTSDLSIPAGTDLTNVLVTGTYLGKDDYANSPVGRFTTAPTKINIPVLNTMVIIPTNDSVLKQHLIEKGIDFIADLLAIDGVQEVLEKYGVEIKPL